MESTGLFKSGGEQLAEYMSKIPESTVFLFVEQDVDKRSKMYKALRLMVIFARLTDRRKKT